MRRRIFPCSVFAHRQNACPSWVLFHSRSCMANFTGLHGLRHHDSASSACCASATPRQRLDQVIATSKKAKAGLTSPSRCPCVSCAEGSTLCVHVFCPRLGHLMGPSFGDEDRLRLSYAPALYCRFGQWLCSAAIYYKPGYLYAVPGT